MYKRNRMRNVQRIWQLYVLLFPALAGLLLFPYGPMYGIVLAFKEYNPLSGIIGSPWVGMKHFNRFFRSPFFSQIIWNTLYLSLYGLFIGFPLPVLLALGLNQVRSLGFKKTVQTVTYAPYFISTVVLVGIINIVFAETGFVNQFLKMIGKESVLFMGSARYWRHIYVWSALWQNTGYNAIIYLAALTSVDPGLYEAARVDGVNKFQKIWYIDLPCIRNTIVIMFILNMGFVMSLGFEKAFLMQNPLNLETAEIMSTYVYKMGLVNNDFSYSTAIGVINSLINVALILLFNYLAKLRQKDGGLW